MIIIREDIDQFDDEIRIGAARRDEKLGLDAAGNRDIASQRICLIDEHVGSRGGESLILSHEVARISDGVAIPLFRVRNRIHRIANVFVEGNIARRSAAGSRRSRAARWRSLPGYAVTKPELSVVHQIQGRVRRSRRRPVRNIAPLVRSGIEHIHFFDLRDVAFVFQKVIEERQLEMFAIVDTGLHSKVSGAQPVAV